MKTRKVQDVKEDSIVQDRVRAGTDSRRRMSDMRVPALGLSSLRMVRLSPDSADGTHIPIAKMLVVEPGNLSLDKCEYLGTRPSDDVISELSRALRERPCWYAGFH